jgi:hypothetical protein
MKKNEREEVVEQAGIKVDTILRVFSSSSLEGLYTVSDYSIVIKLQDVRERRKERDRIFRGV